MHGSTTQPSQSVRVARAKVKDVEITLESIAKEISDFKSEMNSRFDELMQITCRIDKRTEDAYTFAESNDAEIKQIKNILENKQIT